MAEAAIEEGICDAVEMTRAQIADPDLGDKVPAGERRTGAAVPAVQPALHGARCPQPHRLVLGRPSAGLSRGHRAGGRPLAAPGERARRRGGPAGLEAARRRRRRRPHRGPSCEAGHRLGGARRRAGPLGRVSWGPAIVAWLERECSRLGVEYRRPASPSPPPTSRPRWHRCCCAPGRPLGLRRSPSGRSSPTAVAALDAPSMGPASTPTCPTGPVVPIWDPLGGHARRSGWPRRWPGPATVTLVTSRPDRRQGPRAHRRPRPRQHAAPGGRRPHRQDRRGRLANEGRGASSRTATPGAPDGRGRAASSMPVTASRSSTSGPSPGSAYRGSGTPRPRTRPRGRAGRRRRGCRRARVHEFAEPVQALFTPLRLGPVVVPNRVVFAAHLTNYAEDGLPTDQHVAYYEARARGGAGLIITEEHSTHPDRLALREDDPRVPPRGRSPATGRSPRRSIATTRRSSPRSTTTAARASACTPAPGVGALARCPTRCSARSPTRSSRPTSTESSRAMPSPPANCAEGGFDGVELQCSHTSIVRQFLSRPPTRAPTTTAARSRTGPGSSRDRRRRARRPSAPTGRSGSGSAATN